MLRIRNTVSVMVALLTLGHATAGKAERVRVATLVPFVADAIGMLHDEAVLVASTRGTGSDPRSDPALFDLGSPHAPNLEVLVSAQADLLVVDAAMHAVFGERAEHLRMRVLAIDTSSVASTFTGLRELASLVGDDGRVQEWIAQQEAQLSTGSSDLSARVLALYATPGAPVVITERGWLGDLFRRVGVQNVANGVSGRESYPGFVTLSEEVLSTLRPDWIFLVTHGSSEAALASLHERLRSETAWRGLRDSAADRVLVLPPELFSSNPGLRMTEAARFVVTTLQARGR